MDRTRGGIRGDTKNCLHPDCLAVYAVLSIFGIGNARADNHSDEGAAYAHAMTNVAIADASQYCTSTKPHKATKSGGQWNVTNQAGNIVSCTGVETFHLFAVACSARAPQPSGYVNPNALAVVCRGGCAYSLGGITSSDKIDAPPQSSIFQSKGTWSPTGATCGSEKPNLPPVKNDYCQILDGGHQICKDSQGRNCVISGNTGRKYCPAAPNEPLNATDPTRNENITQSAPAPAPGNAPTPPTPRPGENFSPTQGISNTSTTGGNTTVTNTTINTQTGTPNRNSGQGNPNDGGNNPGSGEDDENDSGEASGGGTCDVAPTCTGKAIECAILQQQWMARCENKSGNAGDGLGTLYEGSDRTVGDAFGEFQTRIGEAPLIDAGGQFFSVTASGSCPVFSVPATEFWEPLTFDYHCSGDLNSFLLLGGYLVLAVAAFAAFKIAVY